MPSCEAQPSCQGSYQVRLPQRRAWGAWRRGPGKLSSATRLASVWVVSGRKEVSPLKAGTELSLQSEVPPALTWGSVPGEADEPEMKACCVTEMHKRHLSTGSRGTLI